MKPLQETKLKMMSIWTKMVEIKLENMLNEVNLVGKTNVIMRQITMGLEDEDDLQVFGFVITNRKKMEGGQIQRDRL